MSRTVRRRPRGPRRLADYALAAAFLAVLVAASAWLDRLGARREEGTATVVDGDSLRFGAARVRLRGIDAPEYAQTCTRDGTGYACGRQAQQALAELIGGRAVTCAGHEKDRYGRLLGDCSAGGVALNPAMVAAGWAVAYGDFEAEQAAARAARRGVWAGGFQQPQDWRREHRQPDEDPHEAPGGILAALRDLLRFR